MGKPPRERLPGGGAGPLQQRPTDGHGVVDGCRITGHPGPFGPLGLDHEPLGAHPAEISDLVGYLNGGEGVGGGQAALDG